MKDTLETLSMTRSTFLSAMGGAAMMMPGRSAVAANQTATYVQPQDAQNDLKALWQTLIDVGADPFRTSDRALLEAAYQSTLAGFDRPVTSGDFYVQVASLFAQLNDGHVDVYPTSFAPHVRANGAVFPIPLDIDDEGLYVREATGAVPFGSRVIAIDGRSGSDLVTLALAVVGAQSPALHRRRARARIPVLLFELEGAKAGFLFSYRAPGRSTQTTTIAAAPIASQTTPQAPYTFSLLADGKVGYIDYRRCVDEAAFSTFLERTFTTINQSAIRSLVIDIRSNTGGNSRLNNILWQYVSDKPFKQFGGWATRSSARLKREYGHDKYISIYGDEAWSAPAGKYLEYQESPSSGLIAPGNNPRRFRGHVALLIGTATFSSGMSCAVAAKDYGLATIVGEETGEPVVSTGEIYNSIAPSTLLVQGTFTTKVFFGPKPRPERQGVVPDIAIAPTLADRAAGRDVALERAIEITSAS